MKHFFSVSLHVALVFGSLFFGGCAVYVPMQCAAPDIRQKGEAEVALSWSLTNRYELGATYSPANHLLVRAATSAKISPPDFADTTATYAQNNQYELAIGTYWPLGARGVAGGLVGFGQAHAEAQYVEDGNTFLRFGNRSLFQHRFDAIYAKYSGEAYIIGSAGNYVNLGLAYRFVHLRLTDVTDRGIIVNSAPIARSEPMLFVRILPGGLQRGLQLQVACGVSIPHHYDSRAATNQPDPARQFKLPRTYLSLGLSLYPHVFWRRKQTIQAGAKVR